MTDAEAARYTAVLSWFAKRHPRGSQTSHWDRWLPRAIEEIGEIGIPHDQLERALEYLHNRGLIETLDGTGSFRGAKVTTITERGYRFLDRFEGDPVDNADVIIAASRPSSPRSKRALRRLRSTQNNSKRCVTQKTTSKHGLKS